MADQKTVIIAVDGSEHSKKAFDWYCGNLYQSGDQIVFVHAIDVDRRPVVMHPHGMAYYDSYRKWFEKSKIESKNMMDSFAETCRNSKYNFKVVTELGKPGEVICNAASKEKADHIVMGSRGLGTVRRTLLGSVSDYLLHHSCIPVSVVPPAAE
ncbi:universal stress protein in QAH/OAS sulfhydrylase 3'region-like isoform X2 [Montipora capricornis]|uniref:universal stress protein in QAH/OAS sulfhydrylase 3'region-like isoform X2 n=1 Tax=Montipora foliosa TaxID=591990 RepID=UPI0035F19BD3